MPAPPTSAVPGCGIRVGTRSLRACTRSRLSEMRSPPTRRRLWIPPWRACLIAEPRRATPLFCGCWESIDSKSTSSSSASLRSRRARSSSRSRMGLGRREARRRASLAKLRASPGVGGPAGPSWRSRSGERLPGSKSSSPRLSQSPSSGSGDELGAKRREPLPLPFVRPFAREPMPLEPLARPLPRWRSPSSYSRSGSSRPVPFPGESLSFGSRCSVRDADRPRSTSKSKSKSSVMSREATPGARSVSGSSSRLYVKSTGAHGPSRPARRKSAV